VFCEQIWERSIFSSKIEIFDKNLILVKNKNVGQKSKFWTKIEILVKNRNFGQISKYWSNIKILVEILDKNRNVGQKSKFWSKMQILVKNLNFYQKSKFSKFWSKIQILVKNANFGQKFKFLSKIQIFEILVENPNFGQTSAANVTRPIIWWHFLIKFQFYDFFLSNFIFSRFCNRRRILIGRGFLRHSGRWKRLYLCMEFGRFLNILWNRENLGYNILELSGM